VIDDVDVIEGAAHRRRVALKATGIPTMIYYPVGLHLQRAFAGLSGGDSLDVTEHLCKTVLSLPIGPYISEGEISEITSCIADFIKNNS
jgi:dTDP-4-amino-4,6-dideoxygalactose transaminase